MEPAVQQRPVALELQKGARVIVLGLQRERKGLRAQDDLQVKGRSIPNPCDLHVPTVLGQLKRLTGKGDPVGAEAVQSDKGIGF